MPGGIEVLVGSIREETRTTARAVREDWALLAITLSRRGLAPLQLQRSLYLLREAFPRELGPDFYEFRSINSGQFSPEISPDAQALASQGVVAIEVSEQEGWQHYSATAAGMERARQLESFLRPPVVHYLRRVVEWASTRTFDQLVRRPFESDYSVPGIPVDSRPSTPR
jgi:hypothetical protein